MLCDALGLLGRRLFFLLKAGVGTTGEFTLEFLDPPSGIDILQLAGIKRMARVANVNLQFFTRAASCKRIATAAGDGGLEVFRVDAVFHLAFLPVVHEGEFCRW